MAEDVIVNVCCVGKDPPSVPVNEDPGVTDETHAVVAFEPLVHVTLPELLVAVFATVIDEGAPGVIVVSAIASALADGSFDVTTLDSISTDVPEALVAVANALKYKAGGLASPLVIV